jgi:hypothetical protein
VWRLNLAARLREQDHVQKQLLERKAYRDRREAERVAHRLVADACEVDRAPERKTEQIDLVAQLAQCFEDVAERDRRATILVKRLGRNQEDAVADRGTRGAGQST